MQGSWKNGVRPEYIAAAEQDREKYSGVFDSLDGVPFATIKKHPVTRAERNFRFAEQKTYAAPQALQRDLALDAMSGDHRPGVNDEVYRLEIVRLDERRRVGMLPLGAERRELHDLAMPCVMKRHDCVLLFADDRSRAVGRQLR